MTIYDMSPKEIYQAYVKQSDPAQVIELGRAEIASQLMVDDGFERETAYYAADQILAFAQELVQSQGSAGMSGVASR